MRFVYVTDKRNCERMLQHFRLYIALLSTWIQTAVNEGHNKGPHDSDYLPNNRTGLVTNLNDRFLVGRNARAKG